MSHFCGLVINTPQIGLSVDEALEMYDEQLELPMHKVKTKEQLIADERARIERYKNGLYAKYLANPEEYIKGTTNEAHVKYISEEFPKQLNWTDEECYENAISNYRDYIADGEDWCRIGADGSLWKTTNENAKWDWYIEGGRWNGSIKTKDGEYVNFATLGDIDFSPFTDEDYEEEEVENWDGTKYRPLKADVKFRLTENSAPFCVIIDGEWFERGQMGWWGVATNEDDKETWNAKFAELIKELPQDSQVTLIDFHI